jgi:hypothetical protein
MYYNTFKCPEGHLTKEVENFKSNAISCQTCGANVMAPLVESREIGECEACKDPYELDFECPDEPHHGSQAECGECGAEYYQDFGGELYTINEEARKNFPELPTL